MFQFFDEICACKIVKYNNKVIWFVFYCSIYFNLNSTKNE